MVGTPRRRACAPNRALPLFRTLAVVLASLELPDVISRPVASPVTVILALLAVIAVGVATYRATPGVVLGALPILSLAWLPNHIFGVLPVFVTVIAAAVQWHPARTAVLVTAYAGVGAMIGLHGAVPAGRAPVFFVWLASAVAVGIVARALDARARGTQREIATLERSVVEVRNAERARLADELSMLLVDDLDATHADLDRALGLADEQLLTQALARAESVTRTALARLRGLVSTLRNGAELDDDASPASLVTAIEEVEEVLVGHGHTVELELRSVGPGGSGPGVALAAAALRVAAEHVRDHSPAGSGCTIVLEADGPMTHLTVSHPLAPGGQPSDAHLRALQTEFAAHGGTLDVDVDVDVTGTRWLLRASLPAQPTRKPAETPTRRPWATHISGRASRALLVAVSAAGVLRSGFDGFALLLQGEPAWLVEAGWVTFWLALALSPWFSVASAALLVAGLAGALAVPGLSPASSVTDALGLGFVALVAWRRPRWTLAALLGFAAYLAVATWIDPITPVEWTAHYATALVGALLGLAIHHFIALRASQLAELRRLREEQREARHLERRQLAGELHDIVAHQLSLISMQVRAHHDSRELADLSATARDVIRVNASARADLNTLVHVMRDHHDESSSVGETDRTWLTPSRAAQGVATTLRDAGHHVELTLDADVDVTDPTTQRSISRILRESTTNILRYAPAASACRIAVTSGDHTVGVAVTNPMAQSSTPHPHSTGLGLVGLAERVTLTGGTFHAGAQDGQWVVAAQLRR